MGCPTLYYGARLLCLFSTHCHVTFNMPKYESYNTAPAAAPPPRKVPEPPSHRSNLPQVSLADELRLGGHVQHAVAVPVVSSPHDEVLGAQVRRVPRRRPVRVVAAVDPRVDVAVDKGQPVRREPQPAVPVPPPQVRRRRDRVVRPRREGPRAPVLRVVGLDDPREQRSARVRRRLVQGTLDAGRVEIRSASAIGRGRPVGFWDGSLAIRSYIRPKTSASGLLVPHYFVFQSIWAS